tara:strand:- start:5422 stop:5586 length:165 start_codon:yes stop_codon:yes gene_type:complete
MASRPGFLVDGCLLCAEFRAAFQALRRHLRPRSGIARIKIKDEKPDHGIFYAQP